MNKIFLLIQAIIFLTISIHGQDLKIDAQIRPRLEIRDGFKTLSPMDLDAAIFTSQRTRLKISFQHPDEKIKLGLSLQNVRVWGDISTLANSDINGFATHEAWAEMSLNDNLSVKAGRQEIVYDDHRIFGSVGWAQQARSHDALLVKFKKGKSALEVGLAYNANRATLFYEDYMVQNYKTLQYLWYHIDPNDAFGVSFLVLNNGQPFQSDSPNQEVAFTQTIGTRITYRKNKIMGAAAGYYQGGEIDSTSLSAMYFAGEINYLANKQWTVGLGGEYLSGTDMNSASGDLKSFSPLYGTNHKFNGHMDYFYVGNHGNNVGLTDIYAKIGYKKDKLSLMLMPHIFMAAGTVVDDENKTMGANLGAEVDFALGYQVSKSAKLDLGYSKMLASETMETLKGGDADENNYWFWCSLNFTPELFNTIKPN